MENNTALARFITSLGSLNNYGSTVLQTKQALDAGTTAPLRQNADDIAIFSDALKGIAAIKAVGFSTAGIIAINKQFDSPSAEQPRMPGHLRNSYYNEDDRIAIILGQNHRQSYIPPEVVTAADIDGIVGRFNNSGRTERDAWRVFADLAALQPFQDGNKRTALIAANAAAGTLASGNYLVLPFNDLDRADFTIALMRYYVANNAEEKSIAFERMMRLLPSTEDRQSQLNEVPPAEGTETINAPTRRYKRQFKGGVNSANRD